MAWGAVTLFDGCRCKLLSQRLAAHGAWACVTMSDIGVTDGHKRPCVALRNTHYIPQDDAASSILYGPQNENEIAPQGWDRMSNVWAKVRG